MPKIKIGKNWGMGQSKRVKPGTYDIDDPALFGYGHKLVEWGEAELIEDDPPSITIAPKMAIKQPRNKRKSARKIVNIGDDNDES